MSCKHRHTIELNLPGDDAATTMSAVVTFKPQDADLPYLRIEATARVHSAAGCKIPLGSFLFMCGKTWRVIATTHRASGWATLTIVHMDTIGIGCWSGNVVVCEPCVFPGTEAHNEDIEAFRTNVVITILRPTRDVHEGTVEYTRQLVSYMHHDDAARVKQGWSLHDGARRFRVDSVEDLERLSVLPHVRLTQTGFA